MAKSAMIAVRGRGTLHVVIGVMGRLCREQVDVVRADIIEEAERWKWPRPRIIEFVRWGDQQTRIGGLLEKWMEG